jgi:hypothetical protein
MEVPMYLEIALGLCIVLGVALSWHAYTRPERVLERFMRDLDIPEYVLRDEREQSYRLRYVYDILEDRFMRLCGDIRDALSRYAPDGEARDRIHNRLAMILLRDPNPLSLESLREECFSDLECDAIENDAYEQFMGLRTRLDDLAGDLRLYRTLKKALALA